MLKSKIFKLNFFCSAISFLRQIPKKSFKNVNTFCFINYIYVSKKILLMTLNNLENSNPE